MLLKYETLWGVGSSAKSLEYFDKGANVGVANCRGAAETCGQQGGLGWSDSRASSGEKQRTLRRRTAKETLHLTVAQVRTKATGLLGVESIVAAKCGRPRLLGSH